MPENEQKNASLLEAAKAVLWSFLGVRKRAAHESDLARLKPAYVIVAGIVAAVVFVTGLILIARFVVSRAG